jgi:hypothetical protein
MWSNKAYLLRGTLNHKNGFETRRSSNFRPFSFGSSRFNVQMSAQNGATTQFESDRQSHQYWPEQVHVVVLQHQREELGGADPPFLEPFFMPKTITLPRQALDKHRKS